LLESLAVCDSEMLAKLLSHNAYFVVLVCDFHCRWIKERGRRSEFAASTISSKEINEKNPQNKKK
jgi:hypothetical protein